MSLLDKASLVVTPNAYKAGKLYSVIPNTTLGDMTVVRATTATRVNSLGLIESVAVNVPRIDYTNGSCPSLLVEGQRTNLALRSEEFDNASWGKTATTVTANATNSPSGILTADKLVEDATNNQHRIDQTTTSAIGTNTFSVFVKKSERDFIQLRVGSSGCFFNLTNGTISGLSGVTATIESLPNGWYRCSITRISSVANEIARINLSIGTNNTYLGNGTSGLFIWGAQLEAGSNATSYIPTTSASVTRNADVISKTGISSLIGQTQGVLYVEVIIKNTENQICASIQRDGGINNIFISQENNKPKFSVRANNISIFSYSNGVFLNGINKVALAYNTNGIVSAFLNGVKVSTISTSAFTFSNTLSTLQLFDDGYYSLDNTSIKNSTILFKTALTNAELAQLTTI